MPTPDLTHDYLSEVAKACDLCLKPWRHSVINDSINHTFPLDDKSIDLTLRVECRDKDGKRLKENDFEIEIFRSGADLSITLSWSFFLDRPILWHGKHSVWMDSKTGRQSTSPTEASNMESLARRLRSSFLSDERN